MSDVSTCVRHLTPGDWRARLIMPHDSRLPASLAQGAEAASQLRRINSRLAGHEPRPAWNMHVERPTDDDSADYDNKSTARAMLGLHCLRQGAAIKWTVGAVMYSG